MQQIPEWSQLSSDTQKDFLFYLSKLYSRQMLPSDEEPGVSQEMIDEIIIPILENEAIIPENMDFVHELGRVWDHTNYSLRHCIVQLIHNFLYKPVGSRQAAVLLGLHIYKIYGIARRHTWIFRKNEKGHWQFLRYNLVGFVR